MVLLIGFVCLVLGMLAMCGLNRLSTWAFIGIALVVMTLGQYILQQGAKIATLTGQGG